MTCIVLDYDEHFAQCPNESCKAHKNGSTGTSADSRCDLPGIDFDYDQEQFICEECGTRCIAYYENYVDPDAEERAENMIDITAQIDPNQHAYNVLMGA